MKRNLVPAGRGLGKPTQPSDEYDALDCRHSAHDAAFPGVTASPPMSSAKRNGRSSCPRGSDSGEPSALERNESRAAAWESTGRSSDNVALDALDIGRGGGGPSAADKAPS